MGIFLLGLVAKKLGIKVEDASELLPSMNIPRVKDAAAHKRIIGSHRFGKLDEVEKIYRVLHD